MQRKKARGAFFARGSGLFHGTLNPLSSRSIIKCFIFPVLLYGVESWVLNLTLLKKLGTKCILRLPKTTANNIVRMSLLWPSIRARTLCIKLGFLLKIMKGDDSLSSRVFRSIAANDEESLVLEKQCRLPEANYGSNYTSDVISNPDMVPPLTVAGPRSGTMLWRKVPLALHAHSPYCGSSAAALKPLPTARLLLIFCRVTPL